MSDKEILEKSIQKALDNGWNFNRIDMIDIPKELAEWVLDYEPIRYPFLLYNHDFAKALWGEGKISTDVLIPVTKRDLNLKATRITWEYHLQQMIVSPDPLKYLEEHLDD